MIESKKSTNKLLSTKRRYKVLFDKIVKCICDPNFLLFTMIAIVFYGSLVEVSYSRCTYRMYFNDWSNEYRHYIGTGRILTAFLWKAVNILKIDFKITYLYSFILAIISLSLSMFILWKEIIKIINNRIISYIVAIIIIINPFLIELFLYIEKGIMCLAILFAILSYRCINKYYFLNCKKIYLVYAALLMLLLNFSYQSVGGIFIVLSLVTILKYSKNIKDFVKNNVIVAGIYLVPLVIDYLILKLKYTSSRNSGSIDILFTTRKILSSLDKLFITSFNTLPKYVFAFLFGLLIIGFIVGIIQKKDKGFIDIKLKRIPTSVQALFGLIYIIIVCFFVTVFPQYSLTPENVCLTARSTITFPSVIGIMILYIFYTQEGLSKRFSKIYIIFPTIYIVVLFFYLQIIINGLYRVNELDKITAISVGNEIKKYENETGQKIESVVYYKDKKYIGSYPDVLYYNEMNQKVIGLENRNLSLLGYYTGINLKSLDYDKNKNNELEEFFKNNDWDYFSNDQIVFIDGVMHWCLF